VARGELDRARVRLEGLHEHAPGRVAAAAAGELRQQLERPLLGAEVGRTEPRIRVDDGCQRDAGESGVPSPPSAPDQRRALRVGECAQRVARRSVLDSVGVESEANQGRGIASASSRSSRCVPAPMRASSGEAHTGQRLRRGLAQPQ
jgi:hypothetical protein